MPTKKVTPRKTPQKAIALSIEGRDAWDTLKAKLEDTLGMALTHDQVVFQMLKRVN